VNNTKKLIANPKKDLGSISIIETELSVPKFIMRSIAAKAKTASLNASVLLMLCRSFTISKNIKN
jgi:hypothetical protein